jgi:hypothetical protein
VDAVRMKDYRKSAAPGVGELRGAESRRSRSAAVTPPRKPGNWRRRRRDGRGARERRAPRRKERKDAQDAAAVARTGPS